MNSPAETPREPNPPTAPAKPARAPAPRPPAPSSTVGKELPADPSKLTPEEQMALSEKDLKENDWGHQPC